MPITEWIYEKCVAMIQYRKCSPILRYNRSKLWEQMDTTKDRLDGYDSRTPVARLEQFGNLIHTTVDIGSC